MAVIGNIQALASSWTSTAVRQIDIWTGCDRYNAGDACSAWHGTIGLLRAFPIAAWFLAGIVALLIARAVLPPIFRFVAARIKAWRDDKNWGRFMRPYEAYRAGLFRPGGFLLGDMASGMILPLWVRGTASLLTFGGAGTGKGMGLAVTNCLHHRWQCLVDWSAEIVAICLPVWLVRGIKVVIVNPCMMLAGQQWNLPVHRFNPLTGIDPTQPGFGRRCRALAEALFIRTGRESDSFWIDSGVAMVDFCARQVLMLLGENATLIDVYRAILGGLANQKAFFAAMALSEDKFICDAGQRMLHLVTTGAKTAASIVQQIETKLAWMADDQFVHSLSGHDVDFNELRGRGAGRRGCIIVFVLPPDLADSHGAWVKVCLNAVIRAMVDEIPDNKVLLTVDEANVLGNWSRIPWSMSNLRKYRVQPHYLYQSMGQAAAVFDEQFQSMLSNAEVQNFVGVNDEMTADYLSKRLGDSGPNTRVMTPEQLGRLGVGSQISIVRNQRPIAVQNRPYYHRALMRRGVGLNPYHKGMPRLPALYPVWLLKGIVVALWAMSRPTPRQAVIMLALGFSFFWWSSAWALF